MPCWTRWGAWACRGRSWEGAPAAPMATSPRRLILMAGAAIAASVVMATRLLRRGDYGELVLALGATVLFLLVLVGLNSLRRHELIQQALYDPLTNLAN